MLILRRPAGVVTGFGAQRAAGDDIGLAVQKRVLVELGFGQVPVDAFEPRETEFVGAISGVPYTRFLHAILSRIWRLFAKRTGHRRPGGYDLSLMKGETIIINVVNAKIKCHA
jgi:hypothetical protein